MTRVPSSVPRWRLPLLALVLLACTLVGSTTAGWGAPRSRCGIRADVPFERLRLVNQRANNIQVAWQVHTDLGNDYPPQLAYSPIAPGPGLPLPVVVPNGQYVRSLTVLVQEGMTIQAHNFSAGSESIIAALVVAEMDGGTGVVDAAIYRTDGNSHVFDWHNNHQGTAVMPPGPVPAGPALAPSLRKDDEKPQGDITFERLRLRNARQADFGAPVYARFRLFGDNGTKIYPTGSAQWDDSTFGGTGVAQGQELDFAPPSTDPWSRNITKVEIQTTITAGSNWSASYLMEWGGDFRLKMVELVHEAGTATANDDRADWWMRHKSKLAGAAAPDNGYWEENQQR